MRDDLLLYYERELTFLRDMGAEFAQKYPKIASRLVLEADKSRFLSLAAFRMRLSPCVTLARSCARRVRCRSAFPSAPALGSACSSPARAGSFAGFTATMARSDFSASCIAGFGSSPSRRGPAACTTGQD